MRNMILPLITALLLLSGCAASQGWFRSPTTQQVVATGCQAAMGDDNRNNALVNALVPYPEVKAAINTAHLAIQQALQKCVDIATAAAQTAGAKP